MSFSPVLVLTLPSKICIINVSRQSVWQKTQVQIDEKIGEHLQTAVYCFVKSDYVFLNLSSFFLIYVN